jgi:cytochrome o ubiquinol oxidase subunit 2
VKGGGGALNAADYLKLEVPSEKVPVIRYSAVQPELFTRVLNQCVAPGKPCMVDVMAHDRMRSANSLRGLGDMPAGRATVPAMGETPTPALEKTSAEKGSGPNVTKPATAEPPGKTKPGDPRNRNMSYLLRPLQPGTAPAMNA